MNTHVGLIDTHAHLLPGVDDGCATLSDSISCARIIVAAGYARLVCTPHIWPSLPHNTISRIQKAVDQLQVELDREGIPVALSCGGELNLTPDLHRTPAEELVTYAMNGKFLLMDLWANEVPRYLRSTMKWLDTLGLKVILAHPERMRAVQDDPSCVEQFTDLGMLLQGNLQCFGDPPRSATNQIAERFLSEGRYFMVGSDLHRPDTMPVRMRGLDRLRKLTDETTFLKLARDNPAQLIE